MKENFLKLSHELVFLLVGVSAIFAPLFFLPTTSGQLALMAESGITTAPPGRSIRIQAARFGMILFFLCVNLQEFSFQQGLLCSGHRSH